MDKKRILIICPFTPSSKGAGVSYSKQFIEYLSKDAYVDLIYYYYNGDIQYKAPNSNINIIRRIKTSLLHKIAGIISLPFLFPLFTSRFNWIDYIFISKLINNSSYDHIYFDFSQTFSYALFLNHKSKILMSHDVIYQRYKRNKSFLLPWIRFTENILLKRGNIFTFSKKDNNIIKELYNLDSNNTNFFLNKQINNVIIQGNSDYFVFFAAWGRYDNDESLLWFINNVYTKYNLNYKIIIIGGGLSSTIREKFPSQNFHYLGFVDNPYPIIAGSRALISPLHYGAGVKVKCIESLACGTPIIGTQISFEGINDEYQDFMLLAEKPVEYVEIMSQINYPCIKKQQFREFFLKTYNSHPILDFINK